jgi:hypothetical protein
MHLGNLLAAIIIVGLVVFFILIVIEMIIGKKVTGGPSWEEQYNLDWFADNKYCMECGRLCTWNPEPGVKYDERDGRPYMQETWGCAVAGHTHNRLIPRAQRRDYGDAPAQEDFTQGS